MYFVSIATIIFYLYIMPSKITVNLLMEYKKKILIL